MESTKRGDVWGSIGADPEQKPIARRERRELRVKNPHKKKGQASGLARPQPRALAIGRVARCCNGTEAGSGVMRARNCKDE